MSMFGRLYAAWQHLRCPPVLVIDESGQQTDNPQVHISYQYSTPSSSGSGTLMTFYRNSTSYNADGMAEMHGKNLARIFRVRLIDARKEPSK